MTTFSNSHSSLSLGSSGVSLKMCTLSVCSWITWSWPITRLVVRGLGSYKPFRGGNPRRGRRFLLLVVRIHPDILCMLVSGSIQYCLRAEPSWDGVIEPVTVPSIGRGRQKASGSKKSSLLSFMNVNQKMSYQRTYVWHLGKQNECLIEYPG